MSDLEQPESRGISRRTLTKAMAWSVPVIAVAAPAPAFAASPAVITLTGGGCKLPGNSASSFKGYAFRAEVTNTSSVPLAVTITSVTLGTTNLGAATIIDLTSGDCTDFGSSVVVPPNTTLTVAILTTDAASSANGTLTVNYTASNSPGNQVAVASVADASPPVQGASCTAFSGSRNSGEKGCIFNFVGSPPDAP